MVAVSATILMMIGCASEPNRAEQPVTAPAADQPLSAFSQEITSPLKDLRMTRGEEAKVPVTVKNTGGQSWFRDSKFPVRLSYKWYQAGNLLPYEGERTFLPVAEIKPGQSESMQATIVAPDKETGKLTLALTMVQDGVSWFHQSGGTPLQIDAIVK